MAASTGNGGDVSMCYDEEMLTHILQGNEGNGLVKIALHFGSRCTFVSFQCRLRIGTMRVLNCGKLMI